MTAFLLLLPALTFAQQYLVYFQDKGPDANARLRAVQHTVSKQAVQRRLLHGQAFDARDLPVHPTYLTAIASHGQTHGVSRWLNAALISTQTPERLLALPGVKRVVRYQDPGMHTTQTTNTIDHGLADFHINQVGLGYLHDNGNTGAGVPIGVFDSGFITAESNWAFSKIYAQGRVKDTWDYVDGDTSVYNTGSHGTVVWSVMAADSQGTYYGSAPDADYYLYRTENANGETRQEMWNWVMAAERADSLGLWVINNSLGYNTFDNPDSSYIQAEFDGDRTIITQAADLAASRGILVVTSSGNEGNAPWGTITAPCDGDSVLCVGALDEMDNCADFSGDGPTADGRIKPEVMALGRGTPHVTLQEQIGYANGTSLSAPIISGFAACLWQQYPEATNMEIYEAIRTSGDRLNSPDSCLGYGIPDAETAEQRLQLLLDRDAPMSRETATLKIAGNPVVGDKLKFWIDHTQVNTYQVELLSMDGQQVAVLNNWPSMVKAQMDISMLSSGTYLLQAVSGSAMLTQRVVIAR